MKTTEYTNINQAITAMLEEYDCISDEVRFEEQPREGLLVPVQFDEWRYNKKDEDDDYCTRWDNLIKIQNLLQQLPDNEPVLIITIDDEDYDEDEETSGMNVEEQFYEQWLKLTQYNTMIFAGTAVDTGEGIPFYIRTRNTMKGNYNGNI